MSDPYMEKAREIRFKLKLRHEDYCYAGSAYCLNCNEAGKLIALALREAVEEEREANIKAVLEESLGEHVDAESDAAYNQAIMDAAEAIRGRSKQTDSKRGD